MNKSDGDPTPRRKPRTFDLLVYCECGRTGGRLHGIAPGCPGMADELLQYIPGEAPGTIRTRYDPDLCLKSPMSRDDTASSPRLTPPVSPRPRSYKACGKSWSTRALLPVPSCRMRSNGSG